MPGLGRLVCESAACIAAVSSAVVVIPQMLQVSGGVSVVTLYADALLKVLGFAFVWRRVVYV
jgi:hypothetical protein